MIARHLADDERLPRALPARVAPRRPPRPPQRRPRLRRPRGGRRADRRDAPGRGRRPEAADRRRRAAAAGRSGRAARPDRRSARRRPRRGHRPPRRQAPQHPARRRPAPTSPTSASPRRSATAASSSGASIAGTVEYMSPEQWRGQDVGPAADVYSLGCVLYESADRDRPLCAPAADTEPEMPAGLDAVIERAVAKDPSRALPDRRRADRRRARARGSDPGRDPGALRHPGAADPRARRRARRRQASAAAPGRVRWGWLVPPAVCRARRRPRSSCSAAMTSPSRADRRRHAARCGSPPANGAVWVTSARDGTLTRIDPRRRAVDRRSRSGSAAASPASPSARVGLGLEPARPARSCGSTGDTDAVIEQDRRRRPPRRADRLRRRRVWVADEGGAGVTAINAARREGLQARHRPPRGAAAPRGRRRRRLGQQRLDRHRAAHRPRHRGGRSTPIRVGRGPAGITVGGGLVWVANSRSDSVTRVDPCDLALLGDPIAVGGRPGGIDAGTNVVWVANAADDTVSRIDIESGDDGRRPDRRRPRPGRDRDRRRSRLGRRTTATER